jgi:hypothetical protein
MLHDLQCDIIGFSELKLDVSKYQVQKIIQSTLQTQFTNIKYSASTSTIPFDGFYKPGGTFSLAVGPHTSRFHSKFSDSLGRWSTISLVGRRGRVIHFITVYQVIEKSDSGPFTAFQQQQTSLYLSRRDITPRKAFRIDFDMYLAKMKTEGTGDTQFVIMGDFNEVVGSDPTQFARITTKHDLVDIHGRMHTLVHEVPTFARGIHRLDYAFCSSDILPAVAYCGFEPFNQHIFSDHRALFVDWYDDVLFGNATSPLLSSSQRILQAPNLPVWKRYIALFYKYCKDHNVFRRQLLLHNSPSLLRAESVDRDITRAMAYAESNCRSPGKDPWSQSSISTLPKIPERAPLHSVDHARLIQLNMFDIYPDHPG